MIVWIVCPGSVASDTWKLFTSAEGRFSVLFPATPQQSSQPVHLKNGETVTAHVFSLSTDNGNTRYAAVYADLPGSIEDSPQAVLQAMGKRFAAGKTTLIDDQIIDLHGVPGREYESIDSDRKNVYVLHEFLAGTRLYELVLVTSGSYIPDHNAFMTSFKIF